MGGACQLLFHSLCCLLVCSDSQYPALNWQRMASKKMLQEFLNLPAWIQVGPPKLA